jgi:hypothetical protein
MNNTQLGCNPGAPANRQQFFADWTKSSLFGQPTIPGSQNTTVDGRGWPTQDFSLLFYNEPGGFYYPAADFSGVYTITALGCATVGIPEGFGGLTIINQTCTNGNLLAYLEISPDGDLVRGHGAIAFTDTTRGPGLGAGLTNVSLLLPGYPIGTDPDTLHEPALANIRGRCTVARFIGWAMAGHSTWDQPATSPPTPCDWSIRPRIGDPTYVLGGWGVSGLGVPYEMIARIATSLDVDVWLNLPSSTNETARDEYVSGVVSVFDASLPPHRKLFIEYANECFFGNNQCYEDDTALANATVQMGDPYKLNLGLDSPPNATKNLIAHWNPRMYAMNALRLAQVAASIVGASRVGRSDDPNVRIVPVLGALGSYAADGEAKLSWLNAAWGSPSSHGLATMNIGGYIAAARSVIENTNATSDDIIASLLDAIANSTTSAPTAYGKNAFAGYSAAAAYYGVALHAYEGGPDTSGYKGDGLVASAQANVDPRMADVVAGIVANWQSWTGGLFNFFQLGVEPMLQPWGSFTNLWDLRIPDTPKTRGIDRIVNSPPAPLSAGWPIPLVHHNASLFVGYYSPSGLPPTIAPIMFNSEYTSNNGGTKDPRPNFSPAPPPITRR